MNNAGLLDALGGCEDEINTAKQQFTCVKYRMDSMQDRMDSMQDRIEECEQKIENLAAQRDFHVSYSIEVTHRTTGYKSRSETIKTYRKSKNFSSELNSLKTSFEQSQSSESSGANSAAQSTSVSASGSGYGVSFDASVDHSSSSSSSSSSSAASALSKMMNSVSDVSMSSENENEEYSKTVIEYQKGRFQVWRKITKKITIGAETLTRVEEEYIYDTEIDYSRSYYRNESTSHLNDNYLPKGFAKLYPGQTILRYGFTVKK